MWISMVTAICCMPKVVCNNHIKGHDLLFPLNAHCMHIGAAFSALKALYLSQHEALATNPRVQAASGSGNGELLGGLDSLRSPSRRRKRAGTNKAAGRRSWVRVEGATATVPTPRPSIRRSPVELSRHLTRRRRRFQLPKACNASEMQTPVGARRFQGR